MRRVFTSIDSWEYKQVNTAFPDVLEASSDGEVKGSAPFQMKPVKCASERGAPWRFGCSSSFDPYFLMSRCPHIFMIMSLVRDDGAPTTFVVSLNWVNPTGADRVRLLMLDFEHFPDDH